MTTQREFICTACPKGCLLKVQMDGDEVVKMEGYTCKKGVDYGKQEATAPQRMLASTVRVRGGFHPLLPVYTSKPIPKGSIPKVLEALREVEIEAPIKAEAVILVDVAGTGADIRASRDMPSASIDA